MGFSVAYCAQSGQGREFANHRWWTRLTPDGPDTKGANSRTK
jgi:hypothetical protein